MKTVLLSIVFLSSLTSVSAFAATETYAVSAPYVVPSQYGVSAGDEKYCPVVVSASLEIIDGSFDAKSITLQLDTNKLTIPSFGSSQTCMSDIVCPTSDDFSSPSGPFVSLTRKNDGGYPTTDLAGHSDMTIQTIANGKSLACYYDIK